jgi:hypothetical protein
MSCAATLLMSGAAIAMAPPANSAKQIFLIDITEYSFIFSLPPGIPRLAHALVRGPQSGSAAHSTLQYRSNKTRYTHFGELRLIHAHRFDTHDKQHNDVSAIRKARCDPGASFSGLTVISTASD